VSGGASPAGLAAQDILALSALGHDAGRLAYLQKRKLLRSTIVSQLNDATLKEFRANTKNALMLAEAAILLAKRLRHPELVAQSLRVKANVLTAAGQYQDAIQLYDAALAIFTKK